MSSPSVETVREGLLSQDFFKTAASKRKEKLAVNKKVWEESREVHGSPGRTQSRHEVGLPGGGSRRERKGSCGRNRPR